jgi:hypothetical protein
MIIARRVRQPRNMRNIRNECKIWDGNSEMKVTWGTQANSGDTIKEILK